MNSNTYFLISKIFLCAVPLGFIISLIVSMLPIKKYDVFQIPTDLYGLLNKIIWGAKYIVKIDDVWVVARGWRKKNDNLFVIFEPYKRNVIGYKAGHIYEIKNNSGWWIKIPLTWSEKDIEEYIINKNVLQLKLKHPVDGEFGERMPYVRPRMANHIHQSSQNEDDINFGEMSEEEMRGYIRERIMNNMNNYNRYHNIIPNQNNE